MNMIGSTHPVPDSEKGPGSPPPKRVAPGKLTTVPATQHRAGRGLSGAAPAVHGELNVELGINLQTRDAEPHIATGDTGQAGKWNIDPFGVDPVNTLLVNLSSRTDPDVTGCIKRRRSFVHNQFGRKLRAVPTRMREQIDR